MRGDIFGGHHSSTIQGGDVEFIWGDTFILDSQPWGETHGVHGAMSGWDVCTPLYFRFLYETSREVDGWISICMGKDIVRCTSGIAEPLPSAWKRGVFFYHKYIDMCLPFVCV
jgi:hypothetical protein